MAEKNHHGCASSSRTLREKSAYMAKKQIANIHISETAARSALRRKKQKEHELSQTQDQMMTLEREIASIETANINKETMTAMQNASKALKVIHGGLTVDKVDQTMYFHSQTLAASQLPAMYKY